MTPTPPSDASHESRHENDGYRGNDSSVGKPKCVRPGLFSSQYGESGRGHAVNEHSGQPRQNDADHDSISFCLWFSVVRLEIVLGVDDFDGDTAER